jgi:hypothetical protein
MEETPVFLETLLKLAQLMAALATTAACCKFLLS